MTSSIGYLDVVILLGLAGAVARPRVSQLRRMVIATFALMCAWLITAVSDAMRAPGWTMILGGAVILVSTVVATAALHLWTQGGDGDEPGPGPRNEHGGGGPPDRLPRTPQSGGGGRDPSWWPEFERQFAAYLAEREREKRPSAAFPAQPAPGTGPPEVDSSAGGEARAD